MIHDHIHLDADIDFGVVVVDGVVVGGGGDGGEDEDEVENGIIFHILDVDSDFDDIADQDDNSVCELVYHHVHYNYLNKTWSINKRLSKNITHTYCSFIWLYWRITCETDFTKPPKNPSPLQNLLSHFSRRHIHKFHYHHPLRLPVRLILQELKLFDAVTQVAKELAQIIFTRPPSQIGNE
jgi:hypothetical protein